MTWLDCHSLDSAALSLGTALDVDQEDVRDAVRSFDDSVFADSREDPLVLMPREVCRALSRDISAIEFEGAIYFHGTRVLDPASFERDGIRPLGQMLEPLWEMLYNLVQYDCTHEQWAAFRRWIEEGGGGNGGGLYRLKVPETMHHGPFGILVREMFFHRDEVNIHDFLGCPEIVQDISQCLVDYNGINLEERFQRVSQPVIVAFRDRFIWEGTTRAALWYIFTMVREGTVSGNANGGCDAGGVSVPPNEIVGVEVIEL